MQVRLLHGVPHLLKLICRSPILQKPALAVFIKLRGGSDLRLEVSKLVELTEAGMSIPTSPRSSAD